MFGFNSLLQMGDATRFTFGIRGVCVGAGSVRFTFGIRGVDLLRVRISRLAISFGM